jgi:ribonucleoside-diphosphate reductase alpha chain
MSKAKSGTWWQTEGQRSLANNSAVYNSKPGIGQFLTEWAAIYESQSGERGIFNLEGNRRQAKRAGRDHTKIAGTNPCGEIILRANQFCNLTEVVIRESDNAATLARKVELAAILGTWQSSLTNFRYIRKIWKDNSEEERLLGVSLTGIFGNTLMNGSEGIDKLEMVLSELREISHLVNAKEADRLGIQRSAAVTTVKPSGTVSQLTGVSSGIHPWHNDFYIRTVRADNKDPMTIFLKDAGVPNEPDVMRPESTTVFSFPKKAPEGALLRTNVSAIQHLTIWKTYKEFWTDHNPSVTINVRDHEWLDVAAWVHENWESVGGISFLPYSEHIYQQAPYQDITEAEYNEWVTKMPVKIDWNAFPLYEIEDNTAGSQDLACAAGECEVVDLAEIVVSSE